MSLYGQITLFDPPADALMGVCCMDGEEREAICPEPWMLKLIPDGVFAVMVGEHPLVLFPADKELADVEQCQMFHHYMVDGKLYDGIFVGRGAQ